MADLRVHEVHTRQVLDCMGVTTIVYTCYYAFARRLYRLRRSFSGSSLRNEARLLALAWVDRGLSLKVLVAISENVFGLTLTW